VRQRRRGDEGQGSVELVALLPLLVVIALAAAQLLAAGVGRELAAHAAENGAIALGDGEDPRAAVRDALPGWARSRVRITVSGRRVRVRLVPITVFPGAGQALATEARADAGPEAGSGAVAAPPSPSSAGRFGAVTEPSVDVPQGLEPSR
jgi:hypothetical protein